MGSMHHLATVPSTSSELDVDVPTVDASHWIGTLIDDRYRILDYIDEGAMGFVFAGEHVGLRRPVAIKILRDSLAVHADFLAGLEREARAEAIAGSPHIVEVYDFGKLEGGCAYVVMELLEGTNLEGVLRDGPLPWPRGREIALQACQGLAAAHRAGVVHRDIKPANLFLTHDDRAPYGEVLKIVDFGLAELRGEATGSPCGGWIGTPAYMSPEQCTADHMDGRSDLYSLGIVLFEMFSGTLPFEGEVRQVVVDQLAEPPPPLRVGFPDQPFPGGLEAIVARALAKSPDDRFQSAEELEAALRALDAPPPELAITPSIPPTYQPARLRSRAGRAVAIGVSALAALGVLLVAGAAPAFPRAAVAVQSKNARAPEAVDLASLAPAPELPSPVAEEPVVLTSHPSQAAVHHRGVYVGLTPMRLIRPRAESPLELSIGMAGYISREIRVSREGPPVVSVRLEPRPIMRGRRLGWSHPRSHEASSDETMLRIPPNPFGP